MFILGVSSTFKFSSSTKADDAIQSISQITWSQHFFLAIVSSSFLLFWGVFSFGQMFRDVKNIPVKSNF